MPRRTGAHRGPRGAGSLVVAGGRALLGADMLICPQLPRWALGERRGHGRVGPSAALLPGGSAAASSTSSYHLFLISSLNTKRILLLLLQSPCYSYSFKASKCLKANSALFISIKNAGHQVYLRPPEKKPATAHTLHKPRWAGDSPDHAVLPTSVHACAKSLQ